MLKNIAFMCTYYTSSIGKGERLKTGAPNDHYEGSDRFSFHTEEEHYPFIHFSLPEKIHVEEIEITFRDRYADRILPLNIEVKTEDAEWASLESLTEVKLNHKCDVSRVISGVRVTHSGYGSLYFSSLNIFVKKSSFADLLAKTENDKSLILANGVYGLGGNLSVIATALGYQMQSEYRRIETALNMTRLVSFPPITKLAPEDRELLSDSLGKSAASHVLQSEVRLRSERPFSRWVADDTFNHQKRPVTLLTRNNIPKYASKNEPACATMQRLYQIIEPSDEVLGKVNSHAKDLGLTDDIFKSAVGVHVRHGNGELYSSGKTWGVKPPSKIQIIKDVRNALQNRDATNIILCSDCTAVKVVIEEAFPECNVFFISTQALPPGYGVAQPKVFDMKLERSYPDPLDDNIHVFAEILLLSKCRYLCGGRSFFFDAAIGFSSCNESEIFYIDNKDRYTTLPEDVKPLLKDGSKDALEVYAILKEQNFMIDGIFIRHISADRFVLSYYDVPLAQIDCSTIRESIMNSNLIDTVRAHRAY